VFRVCSAFGVLAGLWWGIEQEPHVLCSHNRGTANELNQCTSHVMGSLIVHWGLALGGGVLVGATIGLLLARRIRPPSRSAPARS
jgi:hypothetical protein